MLLNAARRVGAGQRRLSKRVLAAEAVGAIPYVPSELAFDPPNARPPIMPEEATASPMAVKRVIYKEIVEGDRRKFLPGQTTHNRAEALAIFDLALMMGSAKSLSVSFLRPRRKLEKGMAKILLSQFSRGSSGGSKTARPGMSRRTRPPTDARGNEGRIPRVSGYACFKNIPTGNGRLFLLLVQQADDTVWPDFATENSLRAGEWNAAVTRAILECCDAKRQRNFAVAGYIDFTNESEILQMNGSSTASNACNDVLQLLKARRMCSFLGPRLPGSLIF